MTTYMDKFATAYQQELLTAARRGDAATRTRTPRTKDLREIAGNVASAIRQISLRRARAVAAK